MTSAGPVTLAVGPWVMNLVRTGEPENWSRRYKLNVDRVRSGDPAQIAVVVSTLSEREAAKGLSAGEKRMLERARQMLSGPDDLAGDREPRLPVLPLDSAVVALPIPDEATTG